MKYSNLTREEELKNKVAHDWFDLFDCTKIIGNVDFCVCELWKKKATGEPRSLMWAEAKKGSSDLPRSLAQLILTIGKARTFDKHLPPALLGCFDAGRELWRYYHRQPGTTIPPSTTSGNISRAEIKAAG